MVDGLWFMVGGQQWRVCPSRCYHRDHCKLNSTPSGLCIITTSFLFILDAFSVRWHRTAGSGRALGKTSSLITEGNLGGYWLMVDGWRPTTASMPVAVLSPRSLQIRFNPFRVVYHYHLFPIHIGRLQRPVTCAKQRIFHPGLKSGEIQATITLNDFGGLKSPGTPLPHYNRHLPNSPHLL
jgi:hypothetical protein